MGKMNLIVLEFLIFTLSWSSAQSSYNIDDSALYSINFNSLDTKGVVYKRSLGIRSFSLPKKDIFRQLSFHASWGGTEM